MDEATKLLREATDLFDDNGFRVASAPKVQQWRARVVAALSRAPAEAPPREPTTAMISAGVNQSRSYVTLAPMYAKEIVGIWQAMFDAAIAEGKAK